jgi:integrase
MRRIKVDLRTAALATSAPETSLALSDLISRHSRQRADLGLAPRLRKWSEALGDLIAWDIGPEMLRQATAAMLTQGYSPASINRDLSALGQVYLWAIDQRLSPPGFVSPTRLVRRLPEAMRRVSLTPGELAALKAAAIRISPLFGLFAAMLSDSGARRSEVLERSWPELDMEQGRMRVPRTKNGDSRWLFFSPTTMELARSLAKPTGLMFPGRVKTDPIDYRKAWARATGEIGRPDLHMHDLRHEAANGLIERGVPIATAAALLGHRDHTILLRRYANDLGRDHLQQAQATRWGTAA